MHRWFSLVPALGAIACTPAREAPPPSFARPAVSRVQLLRRPAPATSSPDAAARAHLAALWPAAREALALSQVHDLGRGARIVQYRQEHDGLPIFRGGLGVLLGRSQELLAVSGAVLAGPMAASRFRLAGTAAAEQALAQLGRVDARRLAPDRVRPVFFPRDRELRAAYHVEALAAAPGEPGVEAWSLVVDAESAELLFRADRVRTAQPFSYRVYADPLGVPIASNPYCSGGIPHPTGVPDGYQPTAPCAQTLPSLTSYLGTDPWLADDATATIGNNVDAFYAICADADGNSLLRDAFDAALGDFRAERTGARTFDLPYDPALSTGDRFCDAGPAAGLANDPQLRAKIVQAFYVGNVLHDLMRAHGYDEASGNSQEDNFGRGGLGHDPLRIMLGGGTFTAPMSDGYPSYLSMGRNPFTTLHRDDVLDTSVFGHEWMHVLQNRLIADSNGLTNPQGAALGEGWSDFFGLLLTVRPGMESLPQNADWRGVFTLGAYGNTGYCYPRPCTAPPAGSDQSYYFGIRRYPFTVDLGKSPLTFRWLQDDLPLPAGIPSTSWQGRIDNAEGHNAGEIWASALWHCYRALLLDPRYDFATAQGKMLDYLVAGMKLTPPEPTFLEARDALLAAVGASDAADLAHFEAGFAARGMGAGAVSPPRQSIELREVVESFATSGPGLALSEARLTDTGGGGDEDGILDVGETGHLELLFHNTGFVDLSAIAVKVTAPAGAVDPPTQTLSALAAPRAGDLAVRVPLKLLAAATHSPLAVGISFGDSAAGLAEQAREATFLVQYDVRRISDLDDAETEATERDWAPDGDVGGCAGGYPSRDHRWHRAAAGGSTAWVAPAPYCGSYTSILRSPWILPGPQTTQVSFDASFAGLDGGFGSVTLVDASGAVLAEQDFTGTATLAHHQLRLDPGSGPFRIVLDVVASTPAPNAPDLFVVDNVSVAGALDHPFSAIVANGSVPQPPLHPAVSFSAQVSGPAVQFADLSQPAPGAALASRLWSFGDGSLSTDQGPTHTFAVAGEYAVSLTVTDLAGRQGVAVQTVRPEFPLAPSVPYPHATRGTALYSFSVPANAQSLRVSAAGHLDFVEIDARRDKPVLLPPLFSGDQLSASKDLSIAPGSAVLTVPYPLAGSWHLATSGSVDSVVAELVLPPGLDGGVDAGADAGNPALDAGSPDASGAGRDAGSPDGSAPGGDGGPGPGGCSCSSGPGAALLLPWLMALAPLLRRRRLSG